MGFGSQTIFSTHPAIENSTPSVFIVNIHHYLTLSELHPHSPSAVPSPPRLTSLVMFLGPGVLVSRRRLAQSPPLFACASPSRLGFARSATPFLPCYRRQGLQFAVGENLAAGYSRFLRSLHLD